MGNAECSQTSRLICKTRTVLSQNVFVSKWLHINPLKFLILGTSVGNKSLLFRFLKF